MLLWRQITTFSVSVMELYRTLWNFMELYVWGKSSGTLWNFLMCLMELNNYDCNCATGWWHNYRIRIVKAVRIMLTQASLLRCILYEFPLSCVDASVDFPGHSFTFSSCIQFYQHADFADLLSADSANIGCKATVVGTVMIIITVLLQTVRYSYWMIRLWRGCQLLKWLIRNNSRGHRKLHGSIHYTWHPVIMSIEETRKQAAEGTREGAKIIYAKSWLTSAMHCLTPIFLLRRVSDSASDYSYRPYY